MSDHRCEEMTNTNMSVQIVFTGDLFKQIRQIKNSWKGKGNFPFQAIVKVVFVSDSSGKFRSLPNRGQRDG